MTLFGTDGIRALANSENLTAEVALDVAVAAAHILVESSSNKGKRPRAIVGQDSRASGEFLEAAIVAGRFSRGLLRLQYADALQRDQPRRGRFSGRDLPALGSGR